MGYVIRYRTDITFLESDNWALVFVRNCPFSRRNMQVIRDIFPYDSAKAKQISKANVAKKI
jgi:hypothetical protein